MGESLLVLARSAVVSAIVFAVELTGVAVLTDARVPPAACFALVQLVGMVVSFVLNKYWAFGAARTHRGGVEAARSAAVSAGSFVLNVALPALACRAHVSPTVAFTGAQVIVGLIWNFPLNRWWVFACV